MRNRNFPKIRGRLAERGNTIDEMALELNITSRALSNKLSGKSDFCLKEVIAGCRFLDCPIEYFFDDELHDANFLKNICVQ